MAKKLSLNTIQRISVLGALNNHKFNEVVAFNRAFKIAEQIELKPEEKEVIHLLVRENGNITWGMDEEGKLIEGFKDPETDIELSDEKSDLLKEIIEKRVKDGITLSVSTDKALMDVYTQIQDPARAS